LDLRIFENKIIYHISDSDLDGNSCRLVAEVIIQPLCKKYIPLNTYNRDMEEVSLEDAKISDIIIFTDITPTKILYEKLVDLKKEIYIFDHHITGKQELGDLENYYFDDTVCGAKIFFDELTKNTRKNRTLSQIIELTDTYDMWRTDSLLWEKAKDLSNVLYSYVNWSLRDVQTDTEIYSEFLRIQHKKIQENKSFTFTQYEQVNALKARQKEEDSYKKAKKNIQFRIDSCGNSYGYVEIPSKTSIVCHRLLLDLKEKIKYLIAHSAWDKDSTKVSLRSKDGIDVSKIAEKWNGGGHMAAAAIKLSPDIFKQLREGRIHLI